MAIDQSELVKIDEKLSVIHELLGMPAVYSDEELLDLVIKKLQDDGK